ncbi:MAG: type II/IV secretion system protein [bacterium]|nr:type II/IV secretion system protein [bacterium]
MADAPANNQSNMDVLAVLVEEGKIDKAKAEQIRMQAALKGLGLEDYLRLNKLVSEDDLLEARAKLYKIPMVDLDNVTFNFDAVQKIPGSLANKYKVIAFDYNQASNVLSVAMSDPLDLDLIHFLSKRLGMKIKPYYAPKDSIENAISNNYMKEIVDDISKVLAEVKARQPKTNQTAKSQENETEFIKDDPVPNIVNAILTMAIKSRASDVHIEPMEDKTRIRYRIDGILREKLRIPRSIHDALVSRIKILSDMKIDEKRVPQDGRFSFKTDDREIDLRVSSLPTIHGEKIVMRLLDKSTAAPTMAQLGLRGMALKRLEKAIKVPHGIVLITGPTGSGKTTTLYSIISKINSPKVNIMTVEDPVEYEIPGVTQVQVNPQAGLTFATALRSFLRQDPDIILVGEIRDRETTELAIQAALTGHLVFSTLHTNSAAGALPRLLDMGAEPFLLASSMTCVVGQRVVRRLCKTCKQVVVKPTKEVIDDIKNVLGDLYKSVFPNEEDIRILRAKGCSECNNTGYKGRVGIFEVLYVTEEITQMILKRVSAGEIEEVARKQGMLLMKQDGYLKALEGITTIEEVLRVAEVG